MSEHAARAALSRMNGREVAIAPTYTALAADLRQMAIAKPEDENAKLAGRRDELCAAYGLDAGIQSKPFAFAQGIAIIPISGTLINRFSSSWGYVTGYNFIRSQVAAAGMDPEVKAIVYDANSYGGEAAGCFECAADMKVLANGKPTLAVIDSNCYSACFALCSTANRIVCTPSGGAGSVGVVGMHVDMSKMLADWGIVVTLITAGDHKADGNPFEPLPKDVRAEMQKNINASADVFIKLIAENRAMTEDAVRATQARCYRADDALAVGFIDAIESPNVAVRGFFGALSGASLSTSQEQTMPATTDKPDAAAEQAAAPATATTEAASAAKQAKQAERTRIEGITSCEEAKGREGLANHFAMKTDMSVVDAKAALAASPKAEPKKAEINPLAEAMTASGGGPKVGSGEGGDAADATAAGSNELLSSYSLASGRKFKLVGAE